MSNETTLIQDHTPTRALRYNTITVLMALVVASLLSYRATTTTLLCDELLFVHSIDLGLEQGMFQQGSSHPPLIRILIGSFANSSSPDWLLRLPSILFSVASIFVWSRILLRMIPDQITRCLLLPAIAFNPVWLSMGYQCLPYAALTFFASLHCWAFMRMCEESSWSRTTLFILSGIALPWTHFFGVNVLIADQFVWLMLLWTRQTSFKRFFFVNLTIAAFTLPMVPIAAFYIWNDRPYPLAEVQHYCTYFVTASSLFFSMVSFPGLETGLPIFLLLYLAVLYYLRCILTKSSKTDGKSIPSHIGMIAIGTLLAGFTATQAHSMLGQTAMYPRYMLAGAWVHLPLIAMLLLIFTNKSVSRYGVLLILLGASTSLGNALQTSDYDQRVARFIKENWQPQDAFLVQSIDHWHGENHFDQLWLDRYVAPNLPKTTGANKLRLDLQKTGLPTPIAHPDTQRIWIYSHLFKAKWLKDQQIPGWKVSKIYDTGNSFPIALLERDIETTSGTLKDNQPIAQHLDNSHIPLR